MIEKLLILTVRQGTEAPSGENLKNSHPDIVWRRYIKEGFRIKKNRRNSQ